MKLNKHAFAIGIDPDCDKNGVAVYDTHHKKFLVVESLDLTDLFTFLSSIYEKGKTIIRLEAGWLEKKKNWHDSQNQYTAQRIASNVGANHEVGRQIEKFLIKNDMEYELLKPQGFTTFFHNAKEFKLITGYEGKTNNDSRSACAMVWDY